MTIDSREVKTMSYYKPHIHNIIMRIKHRIFSVSHSFLLCREPCDGSYIENEYCWFRIMRENDSLMECTEFEDSQVYVPIYTEMLKNGNVVVYGYRRKDNKCFVRACVQLHGEIVSDGCYVKKLNDNEGYIHYVFCNAADRGNGSHNSIVSFICEYLKGYTLYSIVKNDNIASLKGFYRNGFKVKTNLSQYNIGGLRRLARKEVSE